MAASIFILLDDVSSLLENTATMTKIATQKTATLLGDDLAIYAEKASKFRASRELPVIWSIAKGSFVNKAIIIPLALILSYYAPYLIDYILIIGGAYLALEGAEKVLEFFEKKEKTVLEKETDILSEEKIRVKSAIHMDFVLSLEIIIVTLSFVLGEPILEQVSVLFFVSVLTIIGVYGTVAFLVKLDDIGLYLIKKGYQKPGIILVKLLPIIIKILMILGTIAMFTVGGGLFLTHTNFLHKNPIMGYLPDILNDLLIGIVIGFLIVFIKFISLKFFRARFHFKLS